MWDQVVTAVVLAFSVPVFAYSAYTVVLLLGSLTYVSPVPSVPATANPARLTVLLAVYNEKDVVLSTLSAVNDLGSLPGQLQVIIADDSDDETVGIVDSWASEARDRGIDVVLSRRGDRSGFKAGALNLASSMISGEFVLLIDADSRPTPKSVTDGISAMRSRGLSFVSFRVGHYNREENLVTRSFALFQDTVDGLQKMGSTRISLPFSLQGGFVLLRSEALSKAGFWTEGVLAEDADLSCRLFSQGFSGAYLSGDEFLSEDPSTLRIWKRQAARVAQGWAQCLRLDMGQIAKSPHLGILKKVGLVLTLLSPLAGLSWIVVSFTSAFAIVFKVITPGASVFSNPFYVAAVTVPVLIFYASGLKSLSVRRMLTTRNVILLPALSYMVTATFVISSIGYLRGLAGRPGEFFRTPKKGIAGSRGSVTGESRSVRLTEGGVSVLAVVLSLPVLIAGQYLLGLSLLGFGVVTLKSMELSGGPNLSGSKA